MSNKLLFVLVSVLLILTIGLAAGFFMMWNKLSSLDTLTNPAATAESDQNPAASNLGPIFSLDTFIVNLADEKRSRYLRITMDLELNQKTDADKLRERLSQVRDSILMILPNKRFEDIASMDGKIALRDEIISELNSIFNQEVISNIFFTEFVIQ
jgi:flagellar FliL protein